MVVRCGSWGWVKPSWSIQRQVCGCAQGHPELGAETSWALSEAVLQLNSDCPRPHGVDANIANNSVEEQNCALVA